MAKDDLFDADIVGAMELGLRAGGVAGTKRVTAFPLIHPQNG